MSILSCFNYSDNLKCKKKSTEWSDTLTQLQKNLHKLWYSAAVSLTTSTLISVEMFYLANSVDLRTFKSIFYNQIPQDGLKSYSVNQGHSLKPFRQISPVLNAEWLELNNKPSWHYWSIVRRAQVHNSNLLHWWTHWRLWTDFNFFSLYGFKCVKLWYTY